MYLCDTNLLTPFPSPSYNTINVCARFVKRSVRFCPLGSIWVAKERPYFMTNKAENQDVRIQPLKRPVKDK